MVKGSDVGKLEEFHKRKCVSLWTCVIIKFDELVLGGVIKDNKKEKSLILSDTTFFSPLTGLFFPLSLCRSVISHIGRTPEWGEKGKWVKEREGRWNYSGSGWEEWRVVENKKDQSCFCDSVRCFLDRVSSQDATQIADVRHNVGGDMTVEGLFSCIANILVCLYLTLKSNFPSLYGH